MQFLVPSKEANWEGFIFYITMETELVSVAL